MSEEEIAAYIQKITETIRCRKKLDIDTLFSQYCKSLNLKSDTIEEFLKFANEFVANEEANEFFTEEFLIECYDMWKLLSPCACENLDSVIDLVNILWILQNNEEMRGVYYIDYDKQLEILSISEGFTERYLRLSYYLLNNLSLIEHGGNIRSSWLC